MNFIKKIKREKLHKKALSDSIRMKTLLLTQQYQRDVCQSNFSGVGNDKTHEIIISLTSHSLRVNDVHLTIESLLQQTLKADRIILWLAEKDFSAEGLPETLKLQKQRGLEVAFCTEDFGPYTKFYYTLEKYPDSLIVTVDDDILYPPDMLDMLYRAYQQEPDYIHCHRAHKMSFDQNGKICPYGTWQKSATDEMASFLLFPTGVGGVLYFPGCFADEILEQGVFLQLAPHADDVWLKAMSLKKGVLCKAIQDHRNWALRNLVVEGSQQFALKRKNKSKVHGNDSKIKAVFDYYDLWGRFRH